MGGSLVAAVAAAMTAASLAAGDLSGGVRTGGGTGSAPGASVASAPEAGADEWVWPLAPEPSVERRFHPPDQRWLPGHRGVDLAAGVGQVVRAPAAGEVTYVGSLAGRGIVVVTHRGGLRSTFEPVSAGPPVGTLVTATQPVGVVTDDAGHCAPRTCLHWGVLRGRTYLDPLAFVGRTPIILLPLR